MPLIDRLQEDSPKRILALDGGGIRGAITIGYLEKLESILRKRHKSPHMRLSDYFDLIGGTSTGSIIAGGLAIGMEVGEIKRLYLKLGDKIFGQKRSIFKRLSAKFKVSTLEKELDGVFGDITFASDKIKTGLCIVTKRADTKSTWPLINHPKGKFYKYNKNILLKNAIRASSAAPTYFKPEVFDIGDGQKGAFVDGGVSMFNNPSLLLLLMATLSGFPFHWKKGETQLLLASVGTGHWDIKENLEDVTDNKLWDWAGDVISMLMRDAGDMNQLMLQFLSNSPTSVVIDSEMGNLKKDLLGSEPTLHYVRYDAKLSKENVSKWGFPDIDPKSLYEMSAGENCEILMKIGAMAAKKELVGKHFPAAFDKPLGTGTPDFDLEGFIKARTVK